MHYVTDNNRQAADRVAGSRQSCRQQTELQAANRVGRQAGSRQQYMAARARPAASICLDLAGCRRS